MTMFQSPHHGHHQSPPPSSLSQSLSASPPGQTSYIGTSLLNYIQAQEEAADSADDVGDHVNFNNVDDNDDRNVVNDNSMHIDDGNGDDDQYQLRKLNFQKPQNNIQPGDNQKSTTLTFVPCLLLDDEECDEDNDIHNIIHRQRQRRESIWLQGPVNSGKSSLAMNFAYAIAAATADTTSRTINAAVPDPDVVEKKTSCNSVSCVMYMPYSDNDDDGSNSNHSGNGHWGIDMFPLFCGRSRRRTTATSNAISPIGDKEIVDDGHTYWDPSILQRIRIHRVRSVREMFNDMMTMLGKPIDEQPIGGAIVIDGIDQIISNEVKMKKNATTITKYEVYNDYTKRTKTEMDIVNLAKSTADALKETHGLDTSVLVTKTSQSVSSSASLGSGSWSDGSSSVPVWVINAMDTAVTLRERPDVTSLVGISENSSNSTKISSSESNQGNKWMATITTCSPSDEVGRQTNIHYDIVSPSQFTKDDQDDECYDDDVFGIDEDRIVWFHKPSRSLA